MIEDWTIPPTEEFKRIHEDDESFQHFPKLHRWHMMMKCVLNDYFMNGPHRENEFMKLNRREVQHFIHKIYYCWHEMGRELFGDEEE